MRKGDLVLITWRDIRTDLSSSKLNDPPEAISVGCVAKQDRKTVWLKSGWYTDPEFEDCDTCVIPKGCIEKVEKLDRV